MPKTTARGGGAPLISAEDLVRRRELWPVREAAYRLGVTPKTLYRYRDRGLIEFVRASGRTFVTDKELRRYIDALGSEAV